jgi:hypothetical protein
MSLLFCEGFDDYATAADLLMSAAAVTRCSVIAGRGGNGFAAQFGTNGNKGTLAYQVPASAAGNVIAGFALEGISGIDVLDFAMVQFQAGGQQLFSIVQASAAGLLFFDATNPLTPAPFSGITDLSTGLIGSATYKNWNSYIEVQLQPGNPGHVTVKIDGVTVLSTSGGFGPLLSTVLEQNNISGGATTFPVLADFGIAAPFNATITSGSNVACHFTVTATAGTGSAIWTVIALATVHNYVVGDVITAPATTGICNGIVFSTQSGSGSSAIAAVDDFYICDTNGALNNSFLGNTRILSESPSADGATLQWTPSSGASHFALLDSLDYDTSFCTATAAAETDLLVYPAPAPVTGIMRAVQIVSYARTDAGGAQTLSGVAHIGGVDFPTAALAVPAVYGAVSAIMELNPATGMAWTVADVTGAQFGSKRIA